MSFHLPFILEGNLSAGPGVYRDGMAIPVRDGDPGDQVAVGHPVITFLVFKGDAPFISQKEVNRRPADGLKVRGPADPLVQGLGGLPPAKARVQTRSGKSFRIRTGKSGRLRNPPTGAEPLKQWTSGVQGQASFLDLPVLAPLRRSGGRLPVPHCPPDKGTDRWCSCAQDSQAFRMGVKKDQQRSSPS